MDALDFGLKQIHLGNVRAGKELLEAFAPLTPARYNMLHAVRQRIQGLAQAMLRRELGVSRTTVSRMLRRLEELRLVIRLPHPKDRHQRWVTLTTLGRSLIQAAIDEVSQSGGRGYQALCLVTPVPGDTEEAGPIAMRELYTFVLRLRHRLDDTATLTFGYDLDYIPKIPTPPEESWEDAR